MEIRFPSSEGPDYLGWLCFSRTDNGDVLVQVADQKNFEKAAWQITKQDFGEAMAALGFVKVVETTVEVRGGPLHLPSF